MKFTLCFLAIVSWAAAMPAEVPFDALEGLELVPNNIYKEPINPAKPEDLPASRVIGGVEVAPNSIPYQVAIVINGLSFCGGSLISTNRVLTAAHCTVRAVFVNVRLGAHAFNSNEATQVRITSTSIANHPNYGQGSFAGNDVAVISLPSAVTLNVNIQVIPLAAENAGTFAGKKARLTGWGRTSDASNAVSPVLRSVSLEIKTNADCTRFYDSDVVDGSICTSGTGIVGACNGDSGGPLVVDGVQVGVVSFGSTQCQAGNPTVYARVTYFLSWIREQL
uniref:Chymotrypsin BI n=1 Tax=Anoplophora glabripennis TaxID=217634 RepID=V5I8M2_ANOGL